MKKNKLLSLILVMVMVIGLFAGCGTEKPADTTAGKANDPVNDTTASNTTYAYGTVHGVTWTNGGTADKADEVAVKNEQDRNAEYLADTGNTRICEPFTYDYKSLGAMFEGGNMPTVFKVAATEPVKLIKAGWGRDISEQVKAIGIDLSKYNQAVLQTYMDEEGKLYGIPNSAYALCLLANADVFREAGLVDENNNPITPTTWEELLETCNTIKEKTGKGGFAFPINGNQGGWLWSNIAWNYGADLCVMNDDGTYTSQLNSPEAVAAMEMFRDIYASGSTYGDPVIDTWSTCQAHLSAGNVGMIFSHTGEIANQTNKLKDGMDADKVFAFAIPAGPGGAYNLSGGDGYWFAEDATDEQVMAVLEYLQHYGTFGVWDEEVKANTIKDWEEKLAKGIAIMPDFPVFESEAHELKKALLKAEYQTNFDFEAQFGDFYAYIEQLGSLQTEEEGDTQNMYRILSGVIQEIVSNPENVNVQDLMDAAQTDYAMLLEDF